MKQTELILSHNHISLLLKLVIKSKAGDPHLKGYGNPSETPASEAAYLLMCVFYRGSVCLD